MSTLLLRGGMVVDPANRRHGRFDVVIRDGAIAADARDYLERMQSASARTRTLIDDLLGFSRVMRSAEPFVPVNLGVIAKEVLGDLEVRIEKSRARVEVGELPTIEADPMQPRLRRKCYRRVNLSVFRHYIAYVIRGDLVFVVAICHAHRRPEFWMQRIAGR